MKIPEHLIRGKRPEQQLPLPNVPHAVPAEELAQLLIGKVLTETLSYVSLLRQQQQTLLSPLATPATRERIWSDFIVTATNITNIVVQLKTCLNSLDSSFQILTSDGEVLTDLEDLVRYCFALMFAEMWES